MDDHKTHATPAQDVAAELNQLRADFGRLSTSVAELLKSQTSAAAEAIRASMGAASETFAGTAADISNSAVRITSDAQKNAVSAGHDIEASIERNPLTAVMIAAGIGMVLGMMSART